VNLLSAEKQKRKLAAILSADATGYSRLMELDEARTLNTLKAHLQVIGSRVENHRGRVVAIHGDSLLAEFESVVDAVQCAVEIQKEIKARNEELPEGSRMPFRIGINLGDVIEEEGNLYGDGVNVASRLEGLADPGGICISRSVHDHVKSKLSVGYQSLGTHSVKNIAESVRVYRILPEPDAFGKAVGQGLVPAQAMAEGGVGDHGGTSAGGRWLCGQEVYGPTRFVSRDFRLSFGKDGLAASGQAFHRRASVREHDRRSQAGVFHGRVFRADHHVPIEDLLPVCHLPELVVHVQGEAGVKFGYPFGAYL
jgi:class 3 adenylate cyclase